MAIEGEATKYSEFLSSFETKHWRGFQPARASFWKITQRVSAEKRLGARAAAAYCGYL